MTRPSSLFDAYLAGEARTFYPRNVRSPEARVRARRSALLLVAAVAVVLGSAGWICALHAANGRERQRAEALVALDERLDELQLLHWRGVAGDLDPQASLVQETLRWRVVRADAVRLMPALDGRPTAGIEGLLAETASEVAMASLIR